MDTIFVACFIGLGGVALSQVWLFSQQDKRFNQLHADVAQRYTELKECISTNGKITTSLVNAQLAKEMEDLDLMVETKFDTYHIEKLMPALQLIATSTPVPEVKKEDEKPKLVVEPRKPLDIHSAEFKEIEKKMAGMY